MKNLKAVIDLGSLKAKLTIFNKEDYTLVDQSSYLILLGKNIHENGFVNNEALDLLDQAFIGIKEILKNYNISDSDIEIIGTEAIRKAENKEDVQKVVNKHFQNKSITIIDQETEGNLFFKSVSKFFPDEEIITADIGGGSVQLVQGIFNSADNSISIKDRWLLKTGTYYLQQKYSPNNDEISPVFDKARDEINEAYSQIIVEPSDKVIFGSSCMLDFINESKVKIFDDEPYTRHPIYTDSDNLESLLNDIRLLQPNQRDHFYPNGGYFMYGADYLLLNLLAISSKTNAKKLYPTNFNSSYGII